MVLDMKRILGLQAVLLAALVVFGCGGSGGGAPRTGTSPTQATRENVQNGFGQSMLSLAQTGAGTSTGAGGSSGGGATGGTTGAGGGVGGPPMIGAFIHQFIPGGFGGGPFAKNGGRKEGEQTVYFDDYLQLWVEFIESENAMTQLLFEDEAKTKPAGKFETTFPGGWENFPFTFASTFEITAGPYSGAQGNYEFVIEGEMSGRQNYSSVWPGWGTDKGQSTWNENEYTYEYESNYTSGYWFKGNGEFRNGADGFSNYEDSIGYKYAYLYKADGSGSGRIEGPDPGLPATLTWTAEGRVRIVYADGTVDEYDMWGWWGGDGGRGDGDGDKPATKRSLRPSRHAR